MSVRPSDNQTSEADTQAAFLQTLKDKKWEHRMPMMMGFWADSICLGILLVVVSLWSSGTRRRDGTWIKALVLYSTSAAVVGTVLIDLHMIRIAVEGFGVWTAVAEIKCESARPLVPAYAVDSRGKDTAKSTGCKSDGLATS